MNGYYHAKLHNNKFFDSLIQPILEINSFYKHFISRNTIISQQDHESKFVYCYKDEEVSWVELKYLTMQKYYESLKKKESFTRNQNPSRYYYYNSITNTQVSTQ
jgi:hypothetical protein